MSDQKKPEVPTLTVDEVSYPVDEMTDSCKIHYVQVSKLRQKVSDLRNAMIELQEDLVDASVSLEWREHQLRESVKLVDDEEAE
tara:strand:+ start:545 stop:796 length:252 start_codon:yes stop_codon:yes gene_type:complete